MKSKLLIIGASGHGKVIADIAIQMARWNSISFLDDNKSIKSSMGIEVVGPLDDFLKFKHEYDIFIGIGNNLIRRKLHIMLETLGVSIPTLIHPKAVIGRQVDIGTGTAVMGGAVINCCTTIGKGCIINTGSTVDHDNNIEDFVHVSPGVHIAGNVNVGKCSWLGIGSVISNNLSVQANCTIGAGAVVVNDITDVGTYVGIPSRRIK